MNDKASPPPRPLRLSEQVDLLCDAFEAAWNRGQGPRIEDYLDRASEPMRKTVLRELLLAEWDLRRQHRLPVNPVSYLRRFSDERQLVSELWETWQADHSEAGPTLQSAHGEVDTSRAESFSSIHCPHCHNRAELPEFDEAEIVCPACGSSFRLEQDVTVAWQADEMRSLGRFRLLEPVGSGAFGTVHRAHDPDLDRTVAIKIPRASRLADPEFHDRFFREAKSAASLRHPSIVPVYEVGQQHDTPYLVSEFVEGVTLADFLSARRLPHREAAGLIAELAEALEYAHARGVIHRDVKPSNVLLDNERRPHLMDFGLAKRDAGDVTMTMDGQVLGTPAYMSPEQARGEGHLVDRRSDIYSLGVMLYQLLTGEMPFRGTMRMLLYQVMHDEPRRPRSLNDRIPRDLETICQKAMAKEPGRRYATAGELSADLRRFLAGEPIHARRFTPVERGWRWCKRNRIVSSLAASLVLALMLGTVVSSWQARVARNNENIAKAEEQRALHSEFVTNLNLIQSDWEQNNLGRIWNSLEATKNYGDRGFEWYFWQQQTHRSIRTFRGHLGRVGDVAVSPSGRLLATASNDRTVKIWEIDSGREMFTLRGHVAWVRSVNFVDEETIVSSSDDFTVRVWDLATRQERFVLQGHTADSLFSALSADGHQLVTGSSDGTVLVWDLDTRQKLRTVKPGCPVWGLAISPNGDRIITGCLGEEMAKLWHVDDPQSSLVLELTKLWSAAFSPDGKWVIGGCDDHTAKVWDANTGRRVDTLVGHTGVVLSVAFSRDGRHILTSSYDGTAKVWQWDGREAKEVRHLAEHRQPVGAAAFLPGDQRVVTGSADGTAKLWDLTISEPRVLTHNIDEENVTVSLVGFLGNGERLASLGMDGMVRLWNVLTGKVEREFRGRNRQPVLSMAVSPDGHWIITGEPNGVVQVRDVASGRARFTRPLEHQGDVTTVRVSPDGRWIAAHSYAGAVKLWNTLNGKPLPALDQKFPGRAALEFSPDSKSLVTIAEGSRIAHIWDIRSGHMQNRFNDPNTHVNCLAISPDSRLLAMGGWDGRQEPRVELWDWAARQSLRTLRGHTGLVRALCFSPNSRRLVTAGWDATARVWDTATWRELLVLKGHTGFVEDVDFSPDGRRIATASQDGTVRVWTAASAAQVANWETEEENAERELRMLEQNRLAEEELERALWRKEDGAMRRWLVSGPLPLHRDESGAAVLSHEQIPGEARLEPIDGETIPIGDESLTWRAVHLDDHAYLRSLFETAGEQSAAYAVCYIHSQSPRTGLRMMVSNLSCSKIYLNRHNVFERTVPGEVGPAVAADLQLDAGINVLVYKSLTYGDAYWLGSLRLTDKRGNPVTGIKVLLTPGDEYGG